MHGGRYAGSVSRGVPDGVLDNPEDTPNAERCSKGALLPPSNGDGPYANT